MNNKQTNKNSPQVAINLPHEQKLPLIGRPPVFCLVRGCWAGYTMQKAGVSGLSGACISPDSLWGGLLSIFGGLASLPLQNSSRGASPGAVRVGTMDICKHCASQGTENKRLQHYSCFLDLWHVFLIYI